MLNQHKSKTDQDTQPKFEVCLVNEAPTHDLLHCTKFDAERAKLMRNISHVLRKNSLCRFNRSTEQLLGEHNFNTEDSKTVRVELENYFDSTRKKQNYAQGLKRLCFSTLFRYIIFFIY